MFLSNTGTYLQVHLQEHLIKPSLHKHANISKSTDINVAWAHNEAWQNVILKTTPLGICVYSSLLSILQLQHYQQCSATYQ
jgi:hypothetical protein